MKKGRIYQKKQQAVCLIKYNQIDKIQIKFKQELNLMIKKH